MLTAPPSPPDTALVSLHSLRQMVISTQLISLAVTLLLTLLGGNFRINLIYSLIIGNLSSLFINAGRLGLSAWLRRQVGPHDEALQGGWPGWRWMVPVVVVGGSLGYLSGLYLAHFLTGHVGEVPTGSTWRGWVAIFSLSIAASLAVTWYFFTRASLAASEAARQANARLAAQTQLTLLQSQLEPHMLFNTLANLRALIGVDPERAQAMLDRLIDFLRATLTASRTPLHPLQAEFDRVADYLALMQVRMGKRLTVQLDLPPELAGHPVPPLLLQPLVENAIQHGLEPQRRGGRVHVHARAEGPTLVLCVDDSGRGLAAAVARTPQPMAGDRASNPDTGRPRTQGTGFGTAQVRERLFHLYGAQAGLCLSEAPPLPTPGGEAKPGTRAEVRLPLQAPPQN
jgi:hypothetical protein